MSVHSRTVNVLWNKRLSIVLHKCRFPSMILSFGIQLCLRLAESSAQSSSQSEDGVHQDAYERPSAMAGWWLCSVMTSYISVSDTRSVANGTAHSGPSAGACRRISLRAACSSECAQTCPSDRENHIARVRNLQLRLRRHSAIGTRATIADRWCSTLGRCALRRDILPTASGFIKCHWEVDGPVDECLSETSCARLASRVSGSSGLTSRCRSLHNAHKHD